MKDSELQIDRSCHVLYSKPCKKEIQAKIALHYPEAEREADMGKGAAAVCRFPFGLAQRSGRETELSQRRRRHL